MNKKKFGRDWSKVMDKINEQSNGSGGNNNSYKDERIYYPQFSDNGTAQAIIRFLPSPDTDIPYVGVYSHSFKSVGGWYIENCPTTLKSDCPVCNANKLLWDSDPETVRQRKRKLNYYSNILVVKDPANPENQGKVFLYRYGKKVHDKIMEKINPGEDSIDEPIMIFDYYDGADFKLIIKKIQVGQNKFPNYDSCQFDSPSPIGTDAEIEKIDGNLYNLGEFLAESNFKPYTDLETRYNRVTGVSSPSTNRSPSTTNSQPRTTNTEATSQTDDDNVFDGSDDEFFDSLQND